MKILMLNMDIGYGGAEKMMALVANVLCEQHDVTFLTFRRDITLQRLDERVKRIHNTLYEHKIKWIEVIGQIFALHKLLVTEQYDIAIAFLHPAHYMLTLAAIGTNVKVVLSERGDPVSRKKQKSLFVHLIEYVIHYADAYVFQSYGAMQEYPVKCRKKGRIIVNALPQREFPAYDFNKTGKSIVNVGRLELVQKRQDIMLRAFAQFHKEYPEYRLDFVGDGPDEERIKELAKELEILPYVVFHGAKKNVYDMLAQASIFVITSDYEGIPNALLEAMGMGVPCIATDCSPGGARMIIEDGINGYIVPCGDYKMVYERLCVLVNDQELRKTFSQRAVLIREKFSENNFNESWNSFINSLR